MMRWGARWAAAAAAFGILWLPAPSGAAAQWSGVADVVLRNGSEEDITNGNFRPTSNLDFLRFRLFLDAEVAEKTDFFAQFHVSGYDNVFLYGAYLRLRELGGKPVNLNAGLIPTTVGTFGPRTYSDRNPLVGVPLAYNYQSTLTVRAALPDADALLARRDARDGGLPVIYDNCWNAGVELRGELRALDWSVGLLAGSLPNPSRENEDKLPQATGRVAWIRSAGLQIGASGWIGPYLRENGPAVFEPGRSQNDYLNGGYGYDFYAGFRYVDIHSELYRTFWEHPTLPTLRATSGYAEAKYKFRPRWYLAGRYGVFHPDEIRDGSGAMTPWDYRLQRMEYGLGFKPDRRTTVKLVAQHNRFDGAPHLARNHYLMQFVAAF